MEFRDSVRQSGITEGRVFAKAAGGGIDTRGLPVAIPRILLSRQSANFERDFVRPVPVTIVLELPGRRSPDDFRQKGGKLARGGRDSRRMGNHFGNYHPLRIVFFCRSRLLFVDVVFIIGLKPSARLRARVSPALKRCLESDFICARARPRFLPLRNAPEVTLEFIVTGAKTQRSCA